MEINKQNAVCIEWVDSVRSFDWQLSEDVDTKPIECVTVGYVVNETDDFVSVAGTIGLEPPQVCQVITIPKCAVRRRRDVMLERSRCVDEIIETLSCHADEFVRDENGMVMPYFDVRAFASFLEDNGIKTKEE